MIDRERLGQAQEFSGVAQDLQAIDAILSREGVRDVITKFGDTFKSQPGHQLLYGITASGLVVGIREGVINDAFKPGYFKAWVLDATLSADQIEEKMIEAEFSYNAVDRLRDGGTTTFPGMMVSRNLSLLVGKSDEEINGIFANDPGMLSYVRFAERIQEFYYPSPFSRPGTLPSVGDETLYPLQ